MMKKILLFAGLILTNSAYSENWIASTRITNLTWYGTSGTLRITSAEDKEGCGQGMNIYFDSSPGYQEYLSIALAANVGGNIVHIFVNGCQNGMQKLAGITIANTSP